MFLQFMKTLHLLRGISALAIFTLVSANAQTTFSNTGSILIPAGAPGTTSGPANPYPSTLNVAGLSGTITNLTVTLNDFSHSFTRDVDVLLVGPTGVARMLMSSVGGLTPVSLIDLTFADGFPSLSTSTLVSGTFAPTNLGSGNLPAPAPAGPYLTLLSGFNGTNPNGAWSLFVNDHAGFDTGSIAGGYSVTITTSGTGTGVPDGGSTLLLLGLALGGLAAARRTFSRS